MSIPKTPNGRKIVKMQKEHQLLTARQATDERDRLNFISRMNAMETYKNRSEETKQKQSKAKQQKQLDTAEKQKVKKQIEKERASANGADDLSLLDKIVNSLNEIGIEKTLKKFKTQLEDFKRQSDEYLALQNRTGTTRAFPQYDLLMYEIAVRYPKFILELPTSCFTMGSAQNLPLYTLTLEELHTVEARLEKDNIFKNPIFIKYYIKYFPNHVTEMREISDIAHALKLDPSCFAKFKPDGPFRSEFYQNIYVLDTIIKSSPKVLQYLTAEELSLFAKKLTSHIGSAINKCPEVLESLPENFFAKFNPKQVFEGVNKSQLKEKIAPYFAKFPELQTYFAGAHIRPTGRRPKEKPVEFVLDPNDF